MRAPDFWYSPSASGSLFAALLAPLGALYDLVGRIKLAIARPFDPGIPVICIGNLTAGGTGKTPLAILIARHFAAAGRKPYLLTRGYGGWLPGPLVVDPSRHTATDVGDEALLLARAAPTIIAHHRAAGGQLAKESGADLVIMDDGFQNFSLKKTLSILVIDGALGFGNGRVIPAGPLRESIPRGLARADAIVIMESGERVAAIGALASFPGAVFHAVLAAQSASLAPGRYLAFAGIGRPEKLGATLKQLGAELIGLRAFPDHHPYAPEEIAALKVDAEKLGAQLITTEKDLVRIPPPLADGITALPVAAAIDEQLLFTRFLSRLS